MTDGVAVQKIHRRALQHDRDFWREIHLALVDQRVVRGRIEFLPRNCVHVYGNVFWRLDYPFALDLYASYTWDGVRRTGSLIGKRPAKDYVQRPIEELYDLESDADECYNLSKHPIHQERLLRMRKSVDQWQEETEDPWLLRDGVGYIQARKHLIENLLINNSHDLKYPGMPQEPS